MTKHVLAVILLFGCGSGGSAGGAPGTSCATDGGGFTTAPCDPSPALSGCRFCLEFAPDAGARVALCEFACRMGGSDCPSGQSCVPQPGLSRVSSGCLSHGDPNTFGYCQ